MAITRPYAPTAVIADDGQHDAEHDADDAVGAHDDGVLGEPSAARTDAASQVGRGVADERQRQRDDHEPVAVEVRRWRGTGWRSPCRARAMPDHHRPEANDLADDRLGALRERPPVRDGPTEFLFERQEEPGREGERHEPQRRERRELVGAADGDRADLEEGVGGEAGEQQRDADGNGPLGQRCAGRRRRDDGRHDCRSLARRRPTSGAGPWPVRGVAPAAVAARARRIRR